MADHINAAGEFQSDKYPWCKPGFVPLKLTDPGAWQPLWDYAEQRRAIDAGFADDLQACLKAAGYVPGPGKLTIAPGSVADPDRDKVFSAVAMAIAGNTTGAVFAALVDALAVTIAFAARDRANAQRLIADTGGDLVAAVERNWQSVKEQAVTAHGKPGHG